MGIRENVHVALTGGIATGKSTVQQILEEAGVAVLDTDKVAHDLMRPGTQVNGAIVEAFGPEILSADGAVDRKRLGAVVFADPDKLEHLNRLVHPAVREAVAAWLAERDVLETDAVVAVPLLFEAGMSEGWDAVLCVDASPEHVRARLRERGLSEEQAEARERAQWPQAEKRERSDFVITNNGSVEELKLNVLKIWRELTHKEQR